ncbi:Protein sevenless [Gryllus bimaculatus]|nr:Protein sevenless [Gryllus bimaculatus]
MSWHKALEFQNTSCQSVCNGTQDPLPPKEFYCIMGCNDALNRYFQKLKDEIGTPPAPVLVADTLTDTSLSLEWEGMSKYSNISYLVQWRYEELAGAWQYCRNQTWGPHPTILVENLQPYTKYRFRIALLLSPHHSEPIVSEPSVVISTLPSGLPSTAPTIVRATAVDSSHISVSWVPGPFPNGPLLSYKLKISELPDRYTALKDIPASENTAFYLFRNLQANRNYSISLSMRNNVGEGPAAVTFVTTPSGPTVKDTQQPILILGAQHSVIQQGADIIYEPYTLYNTSYVITGMAIHVSRRMLFISESSGYVSRMSLSESSLSTILTPAHANFKPLDLSVDWLNDQLYILGEVAHTSGSKWQVARCGLDGRGLTIAMAGLLTRPTHIEVDPYNGYLFWVTQGTPRPGLYRLDLADISNGVKHEVQPKIMLEDPFLGAFTVDHTNFRLLVANHSQNTVLSVSLDGREVVDLRANTQQPMFQHVVSLAAANGLFFWTNGVEVYTEEYHAGRDSYYHNAYPDLSDRGFVSVCVNLSTSQPVPLPVNPPVGVQAILGTEVAKISWQVPHLVGGQGKGAWQNWSYTLLLKDEKRKLTVSANKINGTTYTARNILPDTTYIIKVAAYTTSGQGPWSSEFRGKTLRKSPRGQQSTVLWSAAEGLLKSDITGENVEILMHTPNLKDATGDHHITDMAWYKDLLYLVTNTTRVYWYNLTSHERGILHDLDSVGSIAVDWIGRKLYWSNPKQQLNITAVFRWNPPTHPNGIIEGYKVECWFISLENNNQSCANSPADTDKHEYIANNLLHRSTYFFQVQARTAVGSGALSFQVRANTAVEMPVPKLLLSTPDTVRIADCDKQQNQMLSRSTGPIDLASLSHEKRIFWLSELKELLSANIDGLQRKKLVSLNGTGLSIAADWIGRHLYWAERLPPTSLTADHRLVYWSNASEGRIYSVTKDFHGEDVASLVNSVTKVDVLGVQRITALGSHLQPYPVPHCLLPHQSPENLSLLHHSAHSVTLQLPAPQRPEECVNMSLASAQYIIYHSPQDEQIDCSSDPHLCTKTITFSKIMEIKNLRPFTNYKFYIAVKNYYSDLQGDIPQIGSPVVFRTGAGAPSPPRDVQVRAYSQSSGKFSESEPQGVRTFPEPDDIILINKTAYMISVSWTPLPDIALNGFEVQCVELSSRKTFGVTNNTQMSYSFFNLQPKHQYSFHLLLFYPLASEPYLWPSDERFIFETHDNYWIIADLSSSSKYIFRVRSRNIYGWSEFSVPSASFDFTEAAMLAKEQELTVVLGISIPVGILVLCVMGMLTFIYALRRREKEKKILTSVVTGGTTRGPDVELATLRELPRRGNFVSQSNALYTMTPDVPGDAELALLPHIRRDQITLTKFLGSGAFGEVFEGIARNLAGMGDTETRVAIKTLRSSWKTGSDIESRDQVPFLQNAPEMHNAGQASTELRNTTDPPYYLELLYDSDTATTASDGYEIPKPLPTLPPMPPALADRLRTFSTSSTTQRRKRFVND